MSTPDTIPTTGLISDGFGADGPLHVERVVGGDWRISDRAGRVLAWAADESFAERLVRLHNTATEAGDIHAT